jgi:phosphate/sulfate permease
MKLKKTIQLLVEDDRLEEALNLLKIFALKRGDKKLQEVVSSLIGRYKNLRSEKLKGLLSNEDTNIFTNHIRIGILELNNTIDEPKSVEPEVREELEKIRITPLSKDGGKIYSWIVDNLMDINICIPLILIIASFIFLLFGLNSTKNLINYKHFGYFANIAVSVLYLCRPLQKYSKYDINDKEIIIPEQNKSKLKSILGIETDYGLNSAYIRAFNELKRFSNYWKFTWVGWILLYSFWWLSELPQFQIIKVYKDIVEPFINNISSLFILYAFLILYFRREDRTNNNTWRFIFLLLFTVSGCIMFQVEGGNDIKNIYSIIGGLFAGLSIALISGRLDSKFLSIPFWIIVVLYIYALIQTSIPNFDKNSEDIYNIWYKSANMNIALIAKSLFLILFSWLTSTNRLLYYLILTNKKENEVERNMDSIVEYL